MLAAALTLGALPAHATSDATDPAAAPSATPAPSASPTPEPSASPLPTSTPAPQPTPSTSATPAPTTEPSNPTDPTEPAEPAPLGETDGSAPRLDARSAPLSDSAMTTMAAPTIRFADVSSRLTDAHYSQFSTEIAWLAQTGVTTGWLQGDGSREFRPLDTVARDAMAAFLYRSAGQPAHVSPTRSPFKDVRSSATQFYREITWAAEVGISRGWSSSSGSTFRPYEDISREAMAAFLYRYAGSPAVSVPRTSPFKDVPTSAQFYKEIVWLSQTGASRGWQVSGGAEFRPRAAITRDAMAAFLYRLDRAGVWYDPVGETTAYLRHSALAVYAAPVLNIRSGPSTSMPVLAKRTEGTLLPVTGSVSSGGWIEVFVEGTRGWASGYYLAGRNGAAITRVRASYDNGYIPQSHLCSLSWDRSELLLCQAASDLERLNRTFRARFGINIPVNDSYRDYAGQVQARIVHGNMAAVPGTSNHGWGAAIDISGLSLPGGYQGSAYVWLRQQLTGYNWVLPAWARPTGSKPEPWHFEYTG